MKFELIITAALYGSGRKVYLSLLRVLFGFGDLYFVFLFFGFLSWGFYIESALTPALGRI